MTTVAAVDLGATNGRVAVARFAAGAATMREAHRFANVPVRVDGRLRWDIDALWTEVLAGLRAAEALAGPLDSIAIDSWAVDYGVVDADGRLRELPIHYRDAAAETGRAIVRERLGDEQLYERTGLAALPFNTVYQLLSRPPVDGTALLVPDLLSFRLCGVRGTESTNASTTGLLDPRTGTWAAAVFETLGLRNPFAPLHRPGAVLGPVDARHGLRGAPVVVAAPSHDTAAAVAGVPAGPAPFAYACTGTWSLVGLELAEPVVTPAARAGGFTNELGVDDSVRFLRNVTGFWLLEECLRAWQAPLAPLLAAAAELPPGPRFDVQHPSLATAGDMPARVAALAGVPSATAAELTRCVLDSLAAGIAAAVEDAAGLAGRPVEVVHLVGGGVANQLFAQLVADACARPVLAGPRESACWGNAVTQAQALGAVAPGRAAGRAVVAAADPPRRYEPSVR